MNSIILAIFAAAQKASVPALLLLSICDVESGLHNTLTPMDGGSASYGVCQVKLNTVARVAPSLAHPILLMTPETNAYVAALVLRAQFERYGDWDIATLAYNQGSTELTVEQGIRTIAYVKKVREKEEEYADNDDWKRRVFRCGRHPCHVGEAPAPAGDSFPEGQRRD